MTPRIYAAKASTPEQIVLKESATNSRPGDQIMAESLAIIDRELGAEPSDPAERAVLRRVIHASADFEYAARLQFSPGALKLRSRRFAARAMLPPCRRQT